ncbi:glycosyltransferase family 61 protein [uncultured Roseobacter sp.]|uniref:glycosyltransferase family 61 protein n=1 Tax=uncultured Roseobacter sp. TaxID=114847 RepID=UPI002607C717|nr:glycosyltransferase family 61 protein [uncultured Roseobacter sp.]
MQEQIIAPYRTEPAWLVTAASFLVDRIIPDCERVQLPAHEVAGGTLRYGRGPLPAPSLPKRQLRSWRKPKPIAAPHETVFDLRRNTPTNWAHFLNNHLPIVFSVCDQLGIDPQEVLLVLPDQTPGYIRGAAAMFGLEILTTDAAVDGTGVLFDATPWTGIRPLRHAWVNTAPVQQVMARLDAAADDAAPRKVFLSRRDTRAPLNEAEVMAWLAPRGFVRIYPEDLTPEQQIQLFRQTEVMVAVHGAGLAPLLYTQAGGRLRQLIEVLHAGHMTDVYRVMAHQVGVQWTGVRGRLTPELIKGAYDLGGRYRAHSLDNFEIDITSLQVAFEMAGLE